MACRHGARKQGESFAAGPGRASLLGPSTGAQETRGEARGCLAEQAGVGHEAAQEESALLPRQAPAAALGCGPSLQHSGQEGSRRETLGETGRSPSQEILSNKVSF